MTRSQMIETVARKTGFTEAQVETTMDALFDQIADCLSAYIPDPTAEPCPKRARLFLRADKRRVSWYTEQNKGRRIRSIKHALQ